uniref:F-box associated domain-containing protein n=1 Tax=Setaria viridis TaxID=4556 RepID=A0A4V6D2T3_SETVI|nr:uncharacterized protein LOC117866822 [Setaria viridis]TKV99814.1 hypothetical protein SEVIR_8G068450v2 [Setaria viridis]TKV99815.1 hypothetical protein SEVIR_8G068450v2 [Setaria viridis]TKV99816.1 hypothetical protein SEVIR_8G068450v2 [Setaria viridis]
MLAFNVDDDTATFAKLPPAGWRMSELMEVWGRPCVATEYVRGGTMLWTLTPEHQWELRCSFAAVPSPPRGFAGAGDMVHGAWDCGDSLLFVMFCDGRGCMYEYGLQETAAVVAREVDDGAAAARDLLPAELRGWPRSAGATGRRSYLRRPSSAMLPRGPTSVMASGISPPAVAGPTRAPSLCGSAAGACWSC